MDSVDTWNSQFRKKNIAVVQGNQAGVSICSSSPGDIVHHCYAYLHSLAGALPSVLERHDNGELHAVQ